MFTCEKCGNPESLPTILIGGVSTALCLTCSTRWHELVSDHKSLRELNYASAVMANAVQRGHLITEVTDPTFNQAYDLYSKHSKILFDLALEWLGRQTE